MPDFRSNPHQLLGKRGRRLALFWAMISLLGLPSSEAFVVENVSPIQTDPHATIETARKLLLETRIGGHTLSETFPEELFEIEAALAEAEDDPIPCCHIAYCDGPITFILMAGFAQTACVGGPVQCSNQVVVLAVIVGDSHTSCVAEFLVCSNNLVIEAIVLGMGNVHCQVE